MEDKNHQKVFELDATVQDWDDDYYHPIAEKGYDKAIPWLLNAMGAQPGDLVLDAGCGPGVHSIRAAKYGCRVDAVDISSTMLGHAKERAAAANVADSITFSQADLTSFDPAQKYPFIFSWGVIIHIPEIDAVIEHLAAAVAPGGSLALCILAEGSADFKIEKLVRRILRKPLKNEVQVKLGTGNWYDMNGERLWVLRFNIDELDAALAGHGFKRTGRKGAEFTEFQRRLPGALRAVLLGFNNLMSRANLLPSLSATQILVYKKK